MRGSDDRGFTLVEVLTSLSVIAVVMTAVTTFFVRSMVTIDVQGARQAAIQVAADAMEQLRQQPAALVAAWLQAAAQNTPVAFNGVSYRRTWSSPDLTAALLAATVTVGWTSRDCPTTGCTYAVTTQISTSANEPVFQSALTS